MPANDEVVSISGDTVTVHVAFAVEGRSRFTDALVFTQAQYDAYTRMPAEQRETMKRARYDAWQSQVRAMAAQSSPEPELEPESPVEAG